MLSSQNATLSTDTSNLTIIAKLFQKAKEMAEEKNFEETYKYCMDIIEIEDKLSENEKEDYDTKVMIAFCKFRVALWKRSLSSEAGTASKIADLNDVISYFEYASEFYPISNYWLAKCYEELKEIKNENGDDFIDYNGMMYIHLLSVANMKVNEIVSTLEQDERFDLHQMLIRQAELSTNHDHALSFSICAYGVIKSMGCDSSEIEMTMADALIKYGDLNSPDSFAALKFYFASFLLGDMSALDEMISHIELTIKSENKCQAIMELNSIKKYLAEERGMYDELVSSHLISFVESTKHIYDINQDDKTNYCYIGMYLDLVKSFVTQENNKGRYNINILGEADRLLSEMESTVDRAEARLTMNHIRGLIEEKRKSLALPLSIKSTFGMQLKISSLPTLNEYFSELASEIESEKLKIETYKKLMLVISVADADEVKENKSNIANIFYALGLHYINDKNAEDREAVLNEGLVYLRLSKRYGCMSASFWIASALFEISKYYIGDNEKELIDKAMDELLDLALLVCNNRDIYIHLHHLNDEQKLQLFKLMLGMDCYFQNGNKDNDKYKRLREFEYYLISYLADSEHVEAMHERVKYFLSLDTRKREIQFEIVSTGIKAIFLGCNPLLNTLIHFLSTQYKPKSNDLKSIVNNLRCVKECIDNGTLYDDSGINKVMEIMNNMDVLFRSVFQKNKSYYNNILATLRLHLVLFLVRQPYSRSGVRLNALNRAMEYLNYVGDKYKNLDVDGFDESFNKVHGEVERVISLVVISHSDLGSIDQENQPNKNAKKKKNRKKKKKKNKKQNAVIPPVIVEAVLDVCESSLEDKSIFSADEKVEIDTIEPLSPGPIESKESIKLKSYDEVISNSDAKEKNVNESVKLNNEAKSQPLSKSAKKKAKRDERKKKVENESNGSNKRRGRRKKEGEQSGFYVSEPKSCEDKKIKNENLGEKELHLNDSTPEETILNSEDVDEFKESIKLKSSDEVISNSDAKEKNVNQSVELNNEAKSQLLSKSAKKKAKRNARKQKVENANNGSNRRRGRRKKESEQSGFYDGSNNTLWFDAFEISEPKFCEDKKVKNENLGEKELHLNDSTPKEEILNSEIDFNDYIFNSKSYYEPPVNDNKPVDTIPLSETTKMILSYLPCSLLVGSRVRKSIELAREGEDPEVHISHSDIDIVTGLKMPPDHIKSIIINNYYFQRNPYDLHLFKCNELNCEIYFSEHLSESLIKDAYSRDVTINALYAGLNKDGKGNIYDPTGLGIKHLDVKEIHVISETGNPIDRLIEYPIILLRLVHLCTNNYKCYYSRTSLQPAVESLVNLHKINEDQIHYRLNRHFMEDGIAEKSLSMLNRYGIFEMLFKGISEKHFEWLRSRMQCLDAPESDNKPKIPRRGLVYSYFVAARIMTDIDNGMDIKALNDSYILSIMKIFKYSKKLIEFLNGGPEGGMHARSLYFSKINNDVRKYTDTLNDRNVTDRDSQSFTQSSGMQPEIYSNPRSPHFFHKQNQVMIRPNIGLSQSMPEIVTVPFFDYSNPCSQVFSPTLPVYVLPHSSPLEYDHRSLNRESHTPSSPRRQHTLWQPRQQQTPQYDLNDQCKNQNPFKRN